MSEIITNKILDSFSNTEDLKEYASSQYKTIITQSRKINDLEKKVESLEHKLAEAEKKAAVSSALSIQQDEGSSDTETICVIQVAMLKGLAMNRELTLEECKKLEAYTKVMLSLKGKSTIEDKQKDVGSKLTTEQLMALAASLTEQ